MARLTEVLVPIGIMLLGVVATILGLVAESERIKAYQVISYNGDCIYPSNPALVLGVTAAFCLLLAQLVANVSGGCICCTTGPSGPYKSSCSKSIAIVCLVLSWVTFFNAFVLLLAGANIQNYHQQDDLWFGNKCYVVKAGVLATGAWLSLATAGFGAGYVLAVRKVKKTARGDEKLPAIAVGQPYIPQTGPGFVPQDYRGQGIGQSHPLGVGGYPPSIPYAGYAELSQAHPKCSI